MRISDWSSDVCSSDLDRRMRRGDPPAQGSPQPRQPPQPVSQAMTDGYRLERDADLTTRNTFGVPARAPLLAEVDDAAALPQLFADGIVDVARSEEHTSELQSLMRISYAVFCLKKKKKHLKRKNS